MKRNVRFGVFETNSSSMHSLTIVSKEEFDKFKRGELIWDNCCDELVEKTEDLDEDDYQTYEDLGYGQYETFEQTYKTKGGEEVVAFGYYGYDG